MSVPTHCNFAGGKCEHNNTRECPNMPILKHCAVLREKYRRAKAKESENESKPVD